MDGTDSRSSSLTRSPSPVPEVVPVQPDHFWGQDDIQCPPSPDSNGRTWLDPEDDPFAQRGIPVFKPTMDEFRDFEQYMKRVECWGMKSGIVKVIPPKEWTDSLPPTKNKLPGVILKSPIEQNLIGRTGRFRAQNVERKSMSLRQWVEKCREDDYRAPGVKEVGLPGERAPPPPIKHRTHRGRNNKAATETSTPAQSEPPEDVQTSIPSPPQSDKEAREGSVEEGSADMDLAEEEAVVDLAVPEAGSAEPKRKTRRGMTKEEKQAKAAEGAVLDEKFLEDFDPQNDWLPKDTKPEDYTLEFCRKLEHHFWRNCGIGKPAWYGADTEGSLFTDETTSWNVGHLPSMLARLLPASGGGLPGVNKPYLYFGMWRATFAWHVEDMDLFSINYIHFGAPKFWYAIPQARAKALEQTMKSYFPADIKHCPQFLRHKSFLASPKLLSQSSCKPNTCVQQSGEFIITYPMGYHAGINLGLNCAESVNFALDSWLDLARKAKVCKCIEDSVRIDVDALLAERDAEARGETYMENGGVSGSRNMASGSKPRKRKVPAEDGAEGLKKRTKTKDSATNPSGSGKTISVKLTLGPRPVEPVYGCCLCVDTSEEGLLRVNDAPHAPEAGPSYEATGYWRAHASCATVVTETWVDEVDLPDGTKEAVVFGVDTIPKDRWHLKCTICTKPKAKSHGAPIQCTKGKCPKAFHVSCARQSDPSSANGVVLTLQDVQREILIADPMPQPPTAPIVDTADIVDPTAPFGMPAPAAVSAAVESQRRLFKIIHKFEYNLLCHQHNPATYEAKKNSKADRQLRQLLSLPPMSRIKIRVSAGVFEVSLINVIQDLSMVEVIWDQGQKRTFKFSSIVFGQTKDDMVVGHKPTEVAPEPDHATLMAAAGLNAPAGIMPAGPAPHGGPNTWSYSYTGQPHGHYVNPTTFINVSPPVPTPAPPMIYPRPPLTHAASSSSSTASAPIAPTNAPAEANTNSPVSLVPGDSATGGFPETVYKNSAVPPPPPQAQHERFRVQWKEPYQDPRTWSPASPFHTEGPPVDHYPRVQYYSPDGPHLPVAADPEMQPMRLDPVGYVDGSGALTPSGLTGFPST